jgi:hypothetical protein
VITTSHTTWSTVMALTVSSLIALALLVFIAVKPLLDDRRHAKPAAEDDVEQTVLLPAPAYAPRHSRKGGSAR